LGENHTQEPLNYSTYTKNYSYNPPGASAAIQFHQEEKKDKKGFFL
jgi:hypothetical protein